MVVFSASLPNFVLYVLVIYVSVHVSCVRPEAKGSVSDELVIVRTHEHDERIDSFWEHYRPYELTVLEEHFCFNMPNSIRSFVFSVKGIHFTRSEYKFVQIFVCVPMGVVSTTVLLYYSILFFYKV